MSLLDKLMFWKKEPEFDFGDLGKGGFPSEPPELALPGEDRLGLPKGEVMGSPAHPAFRQEPAGSGTMGPESMGPERMGAQPQFGMPRHEPAPQPQFQQQPSYHQAAGSKDIELISVKIDQLRTSLDVLNQRLSNIERMLEPQRPRW